MEIMNLFFTPEEELQDKVITEYFSDEVLSSNFWLYWRTMFAFEELALGAGDEALRHPLRAPFGRPARFLGPAIHAVQPVRVHDPAHGELP
ncbi:MAG: oleate hydratase [Adlercreutzia equolifaciens]